jgi:hypothetical protein
VSAEGKCGGRRVKERKTARREGDKGRGRIASVCMGVWKNNEGESE